MISPAAQVHNEPDAGTVAPADGTAHWRAWRDRAYPVALTVILLGLWELVVSAGGIKQYLLPTPIVVVRTFVDQFPYLMGQARPTLEEVLLGFAVAAVIGNILAICIATFSIFEKAVYPLLVASQEVPQIAIAPLFLVWFGLGLTPKVIISFLIAFFPVVINSATGLRSVPRSLLQFAYSTRASRLRVLWKVQLPSALPSIFSGLKIAITFAVIGAVVGEFVGSSEGLGYTLVTANGRLDTPLLFAAILVLMLMGVLLFLAVNAVERIAIRWHVSQALTGNNRR